MRLVVGRPGQGWVFGQVPDDLAASARRFARPEQLLRAHGEAAFQGFAPKRGREFGRSDWTGILKVPHAPPPFWGKRLAVGADAWMGAGWPRPVCGNRYGAESVEPGWRPHS